MYDVQLLVMNRRFLSKKKPMNMIGILFLSCLMTVFKNKLLGMLRLFEYIGAQIPNDSKPSYSRRCD